MGGSFSSSLMNAFSIASFSALRLDLHIDRHRLQEMTGYKRWHAAPKRPKADSLPGSLKIRGPRSRYVHAEIKGDDLGRQPHLA